MLKRTPVSARHGNGRLEVANTEASAETDPGVFFGGRARQVACPTIVDPRGRLSPFDFADLPFVPARVFAVTDAPIGAVRGGHAHRSGQQLLVCLQGRIDVELRAPGQAEWLVLEPGAPALLIGPGIWSAQTYVTESSVLLSLSSEPFDPTSYLDHPTAQ